MKRILFFPVIWGLSALAAPAVSMPDKAETVGDLLNVLRDADKMSVQEARMVLEQMPIPENASIPFSKFIRVVRSIVLAVKSTTPIPEHERLRIYQEIEQLDASFCFLFYNFEFCEARENENGAEMEKIVDKINRFLKRHPELGVTSLLPFPNGGMDTLPEEMQQNIINVLRKNENRADGLVSLANFQLTDEYGIVKDVDSALDKIFKAAVMEKMQFLHNHPLRAACAHSAAYAASEVGGSAMPLKIALLLNVLYDGSYDQAEVGSAAYLLAHTYNKINEFNSLSRNMYISMLNKGISQNHPACVYDAAVLCKQEKNPIAAALFHRAKELKYEDGKDYFAEKITGKVFVSVWTPTGVYPELDERIAENLIRYLLNKADYKELLREPLHETMSLSYTLGNLLSDISVYTDSYEMSIIDEIDMPDSEQNPDDMRDVAMHMYKYMGIKKDVLHQLESAMQQMDDYTEASSALNKGEFPVKLLQNMAEKGSAFARYHLLVNQIIKEKSFTQESFNAMCHLANEGLGSAAWFLFDAFKNEKYGLYRDISAMEYFYYCALAELNADAWATKLEAAETDVETILALAHLVNGNKASQYILRYDDALKAYAEAHPETARIICILRFLTMDYALRTFGGETPEDELELDNRLLEVVQTTLPGMLSEKEMAFHKACAEQKYVEARWRQRRSVARLGVPAIKENRAEVVLIKDREIICERFAKDAQALATLCEQHACDFKNADVVLRYADAEVANILLPVAPRSLTALRITTEARAKLRSNGIAAGGYVIDFEKDAE